MSSFISSFQDNFIPYFLFRSWLRLSFFFFFQDSNTTCHHKYLAIYYSTCLYVDRTTRSNLLTASGFARNYLFTLMPVDFFLPLKFRPFLAIMSSFVQSLIKWWFEIIWKLMHSIFPPFHRNTFLFIPMMQALKRILFDYQLLYNFCWRNFCRPNVLKIGLTKLTLPIHSYVSKLTFYLHITYNLL